MTNTTAPTIHLHQLDLGYLILQDASRGLLGFEPLAAAAIENHLANKGDAPTSVVVGKSLDHFEEDGYVATLHEVDIDGESIVARIDTPYYEMAALGHFLGRFETEAHAAISLLARSGQQAGFGITYGSGEPTVELSITDIDSDEVVWSRGGVPATLSAILAIVREEFGLPPLEYDED